VRSLLIVDAVSASHAHASFAVVRVLVRRHAAADYECYHGVAAAEEEADEPTAFICWAEQLRLNTEVSSSFVFLS